MPEIGKSWKVSDIKNFDHVSRKISTETILSVNGEKLTSFQQMAKFENGSS